MTLRGGFACALVVAFVIVAGCASSNYRSVQSGVVSVGKMRVTLGSGWQRAPDAEVPERRTGSRIYSRDGIEHDRLILVATVEDGEAIFRDQAAAGLPVFRAGMSATEIGNLVAKSLHAVLWEGGATVAASDARAHGFTGIPGFRFELEADVPGAADQRGLAGGFIDSNLLYINVFLAESPEYFERHQQTAEDLIESTVLTIKTIRMH